nr:hypothetical protein [Tanacetum cinerariifolium]
MSDSEDSTVTYTTVTSPYVVRSGDVSPREDGPPVMSEDPYAYVVAAFQALPEPDYVPGPEEPEQAPPSPLTPLSSPLPQIPSPPLPASPSILPIPLPTRLSIVYCSRYEAGESLAVAATRPIEGHRTDYGFVGSVEAEIRRRIAEDIGYSIRDTWIDPRDVSEEEALTTLEGVNTRGRQTEMFQRVETLVDDSRYHYETGRLVDQEARCSREAWTHSIGLSLAVYFELQGYMTHTWVQDQRIDTQDTLIATLTTQLSSLQGHLVTALGEIQALQARKQARAGAPEGAGSST